MSIRPLIKAFTVHHIRVSNRNVGTCSSGTRSWSCKRKKKKEKGSLEWGYSLRITCHFLFPGHRAFVVLSKSRDNVVKLRHKFLSDVSVLFAEFYQTIGTCSHRELA